jgi:NADH-quinone oxidoreductase subunit A
MMNDTYFYKYLFIGIFILFALVFAVLPVVLAFFVAPKKPSPSKNASYECGLEAEGDSWIQFRVQYYIVALIFVIFDVETVFIFPWAVSFKELGPEAFGAMAVFIGVLFLGLAYEWKKKTLDWE